METQRKAVVDLLLLCSWSAPPLSPHIIHLWSLRWCKCYVHCRCAIRRCDTFLVLFLWLWGWKDFTIRYLSLWSITVPLVLKTENACLSHSLHKIIFNLLQPQIFYFFSKGYSKEGGEMEWKSSICQVKDNFQLKRMLLLCLTNDSPALPSAEESRADHFTKPQLDIYKLVYRWIKNSKKINVRPKPELGSVFE